MTGACTTFAPSASRRRARPLAWARARVTATLTPANGRGPSQASCCESAATGPTIVIDGGRMRSRATVSAIVSSVPLTVRWEGSVPASTTAAGS